MKNLNHEFYDFTFQNDNYLPFGMEKKVRPKPDFQTIEKNWKSVINKATPVGVL